MKLRFRDLGALVALMALSVYFAAGLWASVCPPEMQMAGVEAPVEQDMNNCPMGMDDTSSDTSESSEQPTPDAPICPLGPLGVGGSCVAASLPSTTAEMAPSFPEDATLSRSPDAARDLLLSAALFHPPKA